MRSRPVYFTILLFAVLGGLASLQYTVPLMASHATPPPAALPSATAVRVAAPAPDGFPAAAAWNAAPAYSFDHDWQGKNSDPTRATEVRLLWTPDTLFLRFVCRYQTLTTFPTARPDGWLHGLWDRDVAETFLQPDSTDEWKYTEFEVAPNGFWIDLSVVHREIAELHSGLKRRVVVDEKSRTWTAELAIPMKALTPAFDPARAWRVNFFRIEGEKEPRFYSAWSPTNSPQPNFHVPSAFGTLVFRDVK